MFVSIGETSAKHRRRSMDLPLRPVMLGPCSHVFPERRHDGRPMESPARDLTRDLQGSIEMKQYLAAGAAALLAAMTPGSAQAAPVYFTGSTSAIPTGVPDGGCGPTLFRNMISSAAGNSVTSGPFSYSHTVCLTGGAGPVTGTFRFVFGGGEIMGALNGDAVALATPGEFELRFTYSVLSGLGQFAGATGSFQGRGLANTNNPPPRVSLAFNGAFDTPAVPEPATWSLMILGFGLTGLGLRQRQHARPLPVL